MSDSDWQDIAIGPSLPPPSNDDGGEWEDVAYGPQSNQPQSAHEAFAGGMLNLLNGLSFGYGDELVAGGSALADALTGGPGYNARLKQIRDLKSGFTQEHPYVSAFENLGGAVGTPMLGLAKNVTGFLPKVATLAGEGGLYGGAYGFGEGENGLTNRLSNAATGAKSGAALSALLGTPFAALESIGPKLEDTGQALQRKALGARQGDYAKTANDLQLTSIGNEITGTQTKASLNKILKDPEIAATTDPLSLLNTTQSRQKTLSSNIRSMIEDYDQNSGASVEPSFNRALSYIEKNVPANKVDNYLNELSAFEQGIKREGGGKLGYLQDQKVALGTMWDPNDSVRNGFVRALYSDLQKTIESRVPNVKGLNNTLKDWMIGEKIMQRSLATQEAASPTQQLMQMLRTSGGVGVPFLAGTYAGMPLLGAGAGGLIAALQSKPGQRIIGQGLEKLAGSDLANKIGAIPALSGSLAQVLNSTPPVNSLAPSQLDPSLAKNNKQQGQAQSLYLAPSQGAASKPYSQSQQGNKQTQVQSYGPFSTLEANPSSLASILKGDNRPMDDITQAKNPIVLESQKNMSDKTQAKLPPELKNKIEADPYFHATALTESGMDPLAKNPDSSAGGLFQFIDKTAKDIGLKNKYDPEQSFEAMQKLTKQNAAIVGNNPEWLYAAHVLGAGLAKKLKLGRTADLTERDKELVNYFKTEALPNFRRNYQRLKTLEA